MSEAQEAAWQEEAEEWVEEYAASDIPLGNWDDRDAITAYLAGRQAGVLWAAERARKHQCCKGHCQRGESCTAYHLHQTCAEAIAAELEGSVKG